jgi:hypothetical protein
MRKRLITFVWFVSLGPHLSRRLKGVWIGFAFQRGQDHAPRTQLIFQAGRP